MISALVWLAGKMQVTCEAQTGMRRLDGECATTGGQDMDVCMINGMGKRLPSCRDADSAGNRYVDWFVCCSCCTCHHSGSVIGLSFHESARIVSQNVAATFVVHEDQDHEWHCWQPPMPPENVHQTRLYASEIRTYLSGYIRSATSIPGPYDRKAASSVSNTRPKFIT